MTDNPIADVLDRAADILTPEGAWTQGAWSRIAAGGIYCFCAEGAIYRASNASPFYGEPTADAAVAFLAARLPMAAGNPIADWNDATGRTQAEVIATLRQAASLAREQGK